MTDKQKKQEDIDLTNSFRIWADKNSIKPIDLSNKMGWSYSYSWGVLRGNYKFNLSSIGKLSVVFGIDAVKEIYKVAGLNLGGEKHE